MNNSEKENGITNKRDPFFRLPSIPETQSIRIASYARDTQALFRLVTQSLKYVISHNDTYIHA